MPNFRPTFATLIAVAYILVCLGFSGMAIFALLGFSHPVMDLFNHAQPILFVGLILLLAFTPVFVGPHGLKSFGLALTATGLAASAFIYIPEAVRGLVIQPAPGVEGQSQYTLVTFNVFGRNETPDAIVTHIAEIDPDIVALQEYNRDVRRAIHDDLVENFPHFQYCTGGERAFVGLYSKIAFEPLNEDACSASAISTDRTARIIVRFEIEGGRDFSVATTHNDWPAPVTRQAEQFSALRDALATVEPPLILAGDFNSTPWSYALRGFVTQSGLTRHTFNLPTFPKLWYYLGGWRPTPAFLPIDHVMTRGGIAIHDLTTGHPSGSDHLPIIVRFSVVE